MSSGLLDPGWIEKQDHVNDKREQEGVYAPGSAIGNQLSRLAERRTDIFGSGAEETQIGKKVSAQDFNVIYRSAWFYLWLSRKCLTGW